MLQHFTAFIQAMLLLWMVITVTCCGILALISATNWLQRKYGPRSA